MEQVPAWEANSSSVSQKIPHISWNQKIRYRFCKIPPLVSILSQENPARISLFRFFVPLASLQHGCWSDRPCSAWSWVQIVNVLTVLSSSTSLHIFCLSSPAETWWHTVTHGGGREVKGKLANGVCSQYPSHYLGTWCIQHYYRWCAHLGCQQSTELTPPPI